MATNTISGTIVSQNGYNSGWNGYGTSSQYVGYNSNKYYTYLLELKTPSFSGVPESLTISVNMRVSIGTSWTLNYALCTSDANKNNYTKTSDSVTDETQVDTGTVTVADSWATITIQSSSLKSDTTYYLYLWANSTKNFLATVSTTSNHTVSLGYNSGLVHIDNGSGFDSYLVYIDNGSEWELYMPYIDNGSDWDLCS